MKKSYMNVSIAYFALICIVSAVLYVHFHLQKDSKITIVNTSSSSDSITIATSDKYQPLVRKNISELNSTNQTQIECLAKNIYHESRGEPIEGQLAVAMVTLNRVNNNKFPNSICGVVKQKTVRNDTTICQFSWHCQDVKLNKQSKAYKQAMDLAIITFTNYDNIIDITKGSLYFHADYVNPRWNLEHTVTIGRHIFYREHEDS